MDFLLLLSAEVFKFPVSPVTGIVMKEIYIADYDLPDNVRRREFYKHLKDLKRLSLEEVQSVILMDDFSGASDILQFR